MLLKLQAVSLRHASVFSCYPEGNHRHSVALRGRAALFRMGYEFLRLKRHWGWLGLIFPQASAMVSNTRS
jgi:hypothetical protein